LSVGRYSRNPSHYHDANWIEPSSNGCSGDGSPVGHSSQLMQSSPKPRGLAELHYWGRTYGAGSRCHGAGRQHLLSVRGTTERRAKAVACQRGATVFAYHGPRSRTIRRPFTFSNQNEQGGEHRREPAHPSSNWAITGLYSGETNDVVAMRSQVQAVARGDWRITDCIRVIYLRRTSRGAEWTRIFACLELQDLSSLIYGRPKFRSRTT